MKKLKGILFIFYLINTHPNKTELRRVAASVWMNEKKDWIVEVKDKALEKGKSSLQGLQCWLSEEIVSKREANYSEGFTRKTKAYIEVTRPRGFYVLGGVLAISTLVYIVESIKSVSRERIKYRISAIEQS